MTWLTHLLKIVLLITLPFIILIRGSLWIYTRYDMDPWVSLLGGSIMTSVLLFIYVTWIYGRLTGRLGSFQNVKRRFIWSMILVMGFAVQGLMYISAKNIKNHSLKKEFTSLHPILRLSVSTLLIIDRRSIMTDAERQPEDYGKMGMKNNLRSLHYRQLDGYVHAVDIRTNGRGAIRNMALEVYFFLMGFNTLRHIGTADHLHVALKR